MRRREGLTACLLGDRKTKLSGFPMRNMKDSTLNWEPRLNTEVKSTPKTRANSLYGCHWLSYGGKEVWNLRGFGHNLRFFQYFEEQEGAIRHVLQETRGMHGYRTLVPFCQSRITVSGNSESIMFRLRILEFRHARTFCRGH